MSDQAPQRPHSTSTSTSTSRDDAADRDAPLEIIEEGGEAACWAHLVCQECGAMVSEGHRPGCHAARADQ